MKKVLIIVSVIVLLLLSSACKEKEQTIVEKYFKAMKVNDNTTLSSMAVNPVSVEFKSFVIKTPLGEKQEVDMTYPRLNVELLKLEKKLTEKQENAKNKKDTFDDAKYYLEDKEAAKEDADAGRFPKEYLNDLQGFYVKADKELKKASREYKSTKYRVRKQKIKIENEKRLMTLSTGITKDIKDYKGKATTRIVETEVVLTDGTKKTYSFKLRKYLVYKDDGSKEKKDIKYNKSRFVILEIKAI